MINEPLFQDNIIATIFRNFRYYLFYDQWIYYAVGTLLVLGLTCFLMKRRVIVPQELFPRPNSNQTRGTRFAFLFLLLTIGAYIAVIFSLEDTLFNNYDLMNLSTKYIFVRGVTPFLNFTRFAPAAFFDLNLVYAVTHNFFLINFYIVLKQLIIACLLYRFLNFLSQPTRLFSVGILLFVPALFWLNNIIFAEQNLLIAILLSLIFAQKFSATGKFAYLWYFAFFTAFAVYTKETTVLFYTGILMSGIIAGIFNGGITLPTLFQPSYLIKRFPVEFIIFIICLSFAIFYFFIVNTTESNVYVKLHRQSLPELFNLFKFEIIVTLAAWIIMIIKLLKNQVKYPLFDEGSMLGGTFILLFIIFYLKIAPVAAHVALKSYYALLPAVFSIIYIIRNSGNSKILSAFFLAVSVYSAIVDYKIYKNEVGSYYRETAEFFAAEMAQNSKISIMFSPRTEESDWIREGWAISYQYFFPNQDITFKFSDLAEKNPQNETTLFLYQRLQKYMKPIVGNATPAANDYFIINKRTAETDFAVIANIPHDLVFENQLFRIYKIR